MQSVLSWPHLLAIVAVGGVLLLGLFLSLFLRSRRARTSMVRFGPAARPVSRKARSLGSVLRRRPSGVPERFEGMDAAEFEAEVSGLLRELGHTVHPAPRPGLHDVDLLLETTGGKVAVQLKRWKAPVGDGSVYALFCGRVHYGTDEAWLITTSEFTRQAARLASTTGVRLVDGIELAEWLTSRREEQLSAPDGDPKPSVRPARSSPRSSETLGRAAPEIAVRDEGEGAEGTHEASAGHG